MTTYYTEIPTLSMRSRAAELVILGRVGRVIETKEEYHDGSPYVRTTFEVEVDQVLKGEPGEQRVAVEVLGGRAEKTETPMQVPVREGERMVLMLSPAAKEGVCVPYLGSAFVIEESRMLLGDHRAEKLGLPDEKEAPAALDLDELRRVVEEAVRTQPDERPVRDLSELPPVTELPDGLQAAGQPATPEPAPDDEEAGAPSPEPAQD
jgi:hypothetical protein